MRIALVSDSHLAPIAEACDANWQAVRDYIAQTAIDLTIHLGDITLDGFIDPNQHDHARRMSAEWPSPLLFIPGNHDIGDHRPAPDMPAEEPLDLALLERYRAAFGRDQWRVGAEDWWLIGINAQLLGTDTAAEAEQWEWLAAALQASTNRPVALLLHKPLLHVDPRDDVPHIRYVPAAPRRRLLDLLAPVDLRLVLSGHTHQYLDRMVAQTRHVWLPSTAYIFPDSKQELIGSKVTGLCVLELTRDAYRLDLVRPEGVRQHNLLELPFYAALQAARRH
jgi:3',5'-cyclic AMP phosphodiesterase CpdA